MQMSLTDTSHTPWHIRTFRCDVDRIDLLLLTVTSLHRNGRVEVDEAVAMAELLEPLLIKSMPSTLREVREWGKRRP